MLVRALLLCRRREGSRCSHVCRAVHWLGWRLDCRCSLAVHVESSVLRRSSAVPCAMTHDDGHGVSLRVCEHGVFVGFSTAQISRARMLCVARLVKHSRFGSFRRQTRGARAFCRFFGACTLMRHLVESSGSTRIEWGSLVKC